MSGIQRRLTFGFLATLLNCQDANGPSMMRFAIHYGLLVGERSSEFPGFRQFSSQPLLICPEDGCLLQNRAVHNQFPPVKLTCS